MASLNRVQLIGRLGADPKKHETTKGSVVASFSLAVDRQWKNGNESKSTTDWFQVVAFGKLGEICLKYLKKGRLVYVEGRLKTEKYEKDGETKYATRVIASTMQMLEKKSEDIVPDLPEPEPAEE